MGVTQSPQQNYFHYLRQRGARFLANWLTRLFIARVTLLGLALLLVLNIALLVVRNHIENDLVQRAAQDLPLVKRSWPEFKEEVHRLHPLIIDSLTKAEPLKISTSVKTMAQQVAGKYKQELASGDHTPGHIIAHIEIIYIDAYQTMPADWFWVPSDDLGLRTTQINTRAEIQQIQQTEILTSTGVMSEIITPDKIANQRRAVILFYLHIEWREWETLITILIRSCQIISLLTTLAIVLWVFLLTRRLWATLAILSSSFLGLVIYSSLMLRALSLRTVLSMILAIQIGPNAYQATDFVGLSLLAGAAYGLILLGLLRLPDRPGCPQCSKEINPNYHFCPFCNFTLKRNCSRCSTPVDIRWNYCPKCSEDI